MITNPDNFVYNRKIGQLEEKVEYKTNQVEFLYNTFLGKVILNTIVIRKWFSKLGGAYKRSKLSAKAIPEFINEHNIDMSRYENVTYNSFNEFFTRKRVAIEINNNPSDFVAVADSKLKVYNISDTLSVNIKNIEYTVDHLFNRDMSEYRHGKLLVFRLSVDDYHRYCYFDNGRVIDNFDINGVLHTVRDEAFVNGNPFVENMRKYSQLTTENFGNALYMEVGAIMVGKITNHDVTDFKKMDERGYFELGGSTVVIALQENVLKFDDDINDYLEQGVEVKVEYGEKIGEKIRGAN